MRFSRHSVAASDSMAIQRLVFTTIYWASHSYPLNVRRMFREFSKGYFVNCCKEYPTIEYLAVHPTIVMSPSKLSVLLLRYLYPPVVAIPPNQRTWCSKLGTCRNRLRQDRFCQIWLFICQYDIGMIWILIASINNGFSEILISKSVSLDATVVVGNIFPRPGLSITIDSAKEGVIEKLQAAGFSKSVNGRQVYYTGPA